MSQIEVSDSELVDLPEWGRRFRLGSTDEDGPWSLTLGNQDVGEVDLWFVSQSDADRAIRALKEHGIETAEQLLDTDSDDVRRICYGALAW